MDHNRDNIAHVYKTIFRILEIEESDSPDLVLVKTISDKEIDLIHATGVAGSIDDYIYKFLEDYDIREIDSRYGDGQRKRIREHLPSDYGNLQ